MKRLLVITLSLFSPLACLGQSFFTQSFPVGSGPNQLIVADFNGDHIPDLATANGGSNTVSILINKGDGTFRPPLEFATGPGPGGLAAVDWNKDGKMDLVVVNGGADAAHSVSILLGNGDGTFQPHHDIPGAPNANSIVVGDFNHDGNPDIATASNSPVNAVYVSLGNGHGGVVARKVTTGFGANAGPNADPFLLQKIAWADYNRDGKDDLYYIECCGGGGGIDFGAWGVLVGNGDGTFTDNLINNSDLQLRFGVSSLDINQDGLSDVIVPYICVHDPCGGAVGRINNGNGTFGDIPSFVGIGFDDGSDIPGGTAFDVDGDGLKDMVAVEGQFNNEDFSSPITLIIARQNADGSFISDFSQWTLVPIIAPLGEMASSIVVADFNHDGKPDLAFLDGAGGNNVFVVLNTTPSSPCQLRTTDHTVTVCHPSDGAVLSSPVQIVSHATSSSPVNATQIYVDNKLVFQTSGGNLNHSLPLAPGTHKLEVKSWSQGKDFRNDFSITAIGTPPVTVPPCAESTNFMVNICSPGPSANVNSPVPVIAAAKSTAHITTMQIYLDGKLIFHSPNSSLIETDVPMGTGTHKVTVKAWDTTGRNFSSSRNISVQ